MIKTQPQASSITLENVLYALADPVRLQIARALWQADAPLTCTQSVKNIQDLAISTRSHCFKILREKGVITSETKGRECYNSLRTNDINQLQPGLLAAILDERRV